MVGYEQDRKINTPPFIGKIKSPASQDVIPYVRKPKEDELKGID